MHRRERERDVQKRERVCDAHIEMRKRESATCAVLCTRVHTRYTTHHTKQTQNKHPTQNKTKQNETKQNQINTRHKTNTIRTSYAEQNKTKRNETKRNKTKQNKTKQNKHTTPNKHNPDILRRTKQNTTKQNQTKQNKTKPNKHKTQTNMHSCVFVYTVACLFVFINTRHKQTCHCARAYIVICTRVHEIHKQRECVMHKRERVRDVQERECGMHERESA